MGAKKSSWLAKKSSWRFAQLSSRINSSFNMGCATNRNGSWTPLALAKLWISLAIRLLPPMLCSS